MDILAKQSYNDYLKGEKSPTRKARPLFGNVHAPDFSKEGILMTEEQFLKDYFHYVYRAYYSKAGYVTITINQYASKTFDELNVQYRVNEARIDFSTQRTKDMVDSIINKIFDSDSDMEVFLLSDGRDKNGILRPRLSSSTAQVVTKKQWIKWMFDKLTDPVLELKLAPKGTDYVSDLIREAIEDLTVLKKSGHNPNPIDITTDQVNYATDLEAQNAKSILETINKLIGHKTIRNLFMHIVDFYEFGGFKLETTTLRTSEVMVDVFELYEFIYPTYSGPKSPSKGSILENLFHYLYGNAYFRFTVVNGKEYRMNLGYSPMPFLSPDESISLLNADSVLLDLFNSHYEREYLPNRQGDNNIRTKAFFDNSIELFEAVEQKVKDALSMQFLQFFPYDKHSVQNILFKVFTSLQRSMGKQSARFQIDNLMRSRDLGRLITFFDIPMGPTHLKIYLTKADLAGRDIFTFPIKDFITFRDIDFDRINMIAINNKIATLWSILGNHKDKNVIFSYIEDVGTEGWQYIGLKPDSRSYSFITGSERKGLENPSHIEIEPNKLFNGDVDEMAKLLKIVRVSMGFRSNTVTSYGNIRLGFVMSHGTDDIAVFDGQRFLNVDEIRSEDYAKPTYHKVYFKVELNNLIGDQNLIDYYNEMWAVPFYYERLN